MIRVVLMINTLTLNGFSLRAQNTILPFELIWTSPHEKSSNVWTWTSSDSKQTFHRFEINAQIENRVGSTERFVDILKSARWLVNKRVWRLFWVNHRVLWYQTFFILDFNRILDQFWTNNIDNLFSPRSFRIIFGSIFNFWFRFFLILVFLYRKLQPVFTFLSTVLRD